jgi:chemotaxis protein methyltransferase WspC
MPIIPADFEQLLKRTMGLDPLSIGSSSFERALQERLAACCLDDLHAYWEHVCRAPAELQALVEAVIVRETWFFREKEAYAALVQIVQQEWLSRQSHGALRVLSLPCATGEEPYSMVMALLDAGISASRISIDAVDISRQALDHAQSAVYGKNSFRGHELDFRDRHFTETMQGYHLVDTVRQQVCFQHGNIFAADFLPGAAVYDIIFCRNVLIYFDCAMQDRAITILTRLLTKTGWLFVGSAETGVLSSRGFTSAGIPLAFAFRKSTAATVDKAQPATATKRQLRIPPASVRRRAMPMPPPTMTMLPSTASTASDTSDTVPATIEYAQWMADQGRLDQAATLCDRHIQTHGPSSQAFHLLGLIQDARGDRFGAVDYYRKVLYLDPQHSDALIHLACLLERHGDDAGARLLRARLIRVDAKRETE